MSFEQKIVINLRQKIKSSGLTMDAVAKKIPTNRSSLSRKLSGKQTFDIETVEGCCRALDIKIEDFFRELTFKETTPKDIEKQETNIIFKTELNFLLFVLTQIKISHEELLLALKDESKRNIEAALKEMIEKKIIEKNKNTYINKYSASGTPARFDRTQNFNKILEKLTQKWISKVPLIENSSEKEIREWRKKNITTVSFEYLTESQINEILGVLGRVKSKIRMYVAKNKAIPKSELCLKVVFCNIFDVL